MSYSTWKIWWHPRLSGRVMAGLEEEAEALRAQIDEASARDKTARSELEELRQRERQLAEENRKFRETIETLGKKAVKDRADSDALKAQLANLRREHAMAVSAQEELQQKYAGVLGELEAREETEEQIRKIEKTLERVQEMKDRYEYRIKRLREEIVRLREKAAGADSELGADTAPLSIDMRPPLNPDEDWLITDF